MFLAAGSDATEQDGRLIILRHTQGYIFHAKDTYHHLAISALYTLQRLLEKTPQPIYSLVRSTGCLYII